MSTVTWNPSDCTSGMVFSDSDLAVSGAASGFLAVRATLSQSSGKWYWECAIGGTTGHGIQIGIASAAMTLALNGSTGQVGNDIYSWGWNTWGGSQILHNAAVIGSPSVQFTAGDTVMIAWDADAGKLWFGLNGTWIFGDGPESGTNPAATGVTGTLFPATTVYYTSADNLVTANFGATSFAYTPPTGFAGIGSVTNWGTGAASFASMKVAASLASLHWVGTSSFHPLRVSGAYITDTGGIVSFASMKVAARFGARASARLGSMSCSAAAAMPFSGGVAFDPMNVASRGNSMAATAFFDLQARVHMLCGQRFSVKTAFAPPEVAGRSAARARMSLKPVAVSGHMFCGSLFSGEITSGLMQTWGHVLAGAQFSGDVEFQSIEVDGDMQCPWNGEQAAAMGAMQIQGSFHTPVRFRGYVLRFEEVE